MPSSMARMASSSAGFLRAADDVRLYAGCDQRIVECALGLLAGAHDDGVGRDDFVFVADGDVQARIVDACDR